jgi:hypothetical protein
MEWLLPAHTGFALTGPVKMYSVALQFTAPMHTYTNIGAI